MQEIPLLDCPSPFLVGDASGKIMNEYGRFPCKIKCGVYAFMVRGQASATINITRYNFKEGDVLWLESGSFLLIHEFSDDALVYYLLFSYDFLEKSTFRHRVTLSTMELHNPIFHTDKEVSAVIEKGFDMLFGAVNLKQDILTPDVMVYVYQIIEHLLIESARRHKSIVAKPQVRRTEIYHEYNDLVLKHYSEWHHVSEYAEAMHLTLPHLCSSIKAACGKTAGELIDEAIITDAKAQLKITNHQIKEIALSLGFENVAFFNRFFKAHTNMTPREHRNSE